MPDNLSTPAGKTVTSANFAKARDNSYSANLSNEISNAVDSAADTVKSYAKQADDIKAHINEEPVKSALWALGIGFLLGRLL